MRIVWRVGVPARRISNFDRQAKNEEAFNKQGFKSIERSQRTGAVIEWAGIAAIIVRGDVQTATGSSWP